MTPPIAIQQSESNNPLWKKLIEKLSPLFEEPLEPIFPKEWNERYFIWFNLIEEESFRPELRYSFEELSKRLLNPDLVFVFLAVANVPEILILGYSIIVEQKKTFYLDTLAIRHRGRGIGHVVMDFIITWANAKQYHTIIVDTEETDEKSISLRRFYAKHGFEVISISPSGDITMELTLMKEQEKN